MHEFSTASQIVKALLEEVERKKAKAVLEVNLLIGRLTFLGLEQLRFSYEALVKDTILEKAKLIIKEKNGVVECDTCSFRGPLSHLDDPSYHLQIPVFTCPKCNSEIRIIEGRECLIKSIKVVV